mmetsp:Transcript_22287/g.52475  ORF Transcript_22287/g.52475 Transcript_22287/m.52475 type:complete len:996 (+) Transcript_22287:157-3144(+)
MSNPLTILYGSATGNAEGIAKDLEEMLTENDNAKLPAPFDSVICKELDQFKKVGVGKAWNSAPDDAATGQAKKHGLIVVASTTGNGDPPENANRFARFIKKQVAAKGQQDFQHVSFAVLGLGDTNYDQFCATGKSIDKSLNALGGHRAKPLACADEATGLEDVVEPWLDTVVQDLAKACLEGETKTGVDVKTEEESKEETKTDESAAASATTAPTTTATQQPSTSSSPPPEHSDAPLYILYGSATGNAESIAKDLASTYDTMVSNPDAKTFWKSVVCAELGQFKKLKIVEAWDKPACPSHPDVPHGVIVVASTTGNGDAPENADRFMRYLKKTVKETKGKEHNDLPFRNVCFSILGLGDTNYDQFCQTGKVLDKQFHVLGGTRAKPLACADEGTGLEDVVDGWTSNILMEMTIACQGAAGSASQTVQSEPVSVPAIAPVLQGNDMDAQEEKKMDPSDLPPDVPMSTGVSIVLSLLGLDATSQLMTVDQSCLPQAASIRVKCQQMEPDQFPKSMETDDDDSVDGCTYSLEKPFMSNIVGARYLTSTSTEGASKICESSSENDATKVLDKQFPIDSSCNKLEAELNGKRVIELTLALPEDGSFEYQPGDSIGLVVTNPPEPVSFVMKLLKENHGMSESQSISIDGCYPTTVGDAIRERIDLCSVIKNRKILYCLSQFATDPREAAALCVLSSKTDEGKKLYETYIEDQRRSIVDLLMDFPSCQQITLEALLSILPPIPPRYYSISSSPLTSKDNAPILTVAFSVVDYLTPPLKDSITGNEVGNRRIHGLATAYLEAKCSSFLASTPSSSPNSSEALKIFPKPTQEFRLPSSLETPVILIGPGTGIAPFMGFLAHRQALVSATTEESKAEFGSADVFFGCRRSDHDWLFKDEMRTMTTNGGITNLNTAFSRDVAATTKPQRKYVQHIMTNDTECSSRLVDTILNKDGRVYICGDGNHMAKDVQQAVADILGPHVEGQDGKAYIDTMKKEGRFLLDIWS